MYVFFGKFSYNYSNYIATNTKSGYLNRYTFCTSQQLARTAVIATKCIACQFVFVNLAIYSNYIATNTKSGYLKYTFCTSQQLTCTAVIATKCYTFCSMYVFFGKFSYNYSNYIATNTKSGYLNRYTFCTSQQLTCTAVIATKCYTFCSM